MVSEGTRAVKYDPARHRRHSIRLRGYDYSQAGAYFVTVCTQGRACLFGEVVDGEMRLNGFGDIVREEWFKTADIRPYVALHPDEFVVMPNHIHGLWILDGPVGATSRIVGATSQTVGATSQTVGATSRSPLPSTPRGPTAHSVGAFIAGYKSAVTKRINVLRDTPNVAVWQRNYYEHIIHNEESLNRIREYIENNPMQWALDRENPAVGVRPVAPGDEPWCI